MRDTDAEWWLWLMLGLLLLAGALACPFGVWLMMSTSGGYLPFYLLWLFVGSAALVTVGGTFGGIGCVLAAPRARRRHLRRVAAARGDAAAMLLADVRMDPRHAPDVGHEPISLLWRVADDRRRAGKTRLMLQTALSAVVISPLAAEFVAPIFEPSSTSAEFITRIVVAVAFVAAVVVVLAILWHVMLALYRRPMGVVATADGIEDRRLIGTPVQIAWSEMQLLEVRAGSTVGNRTFDLYAPRKRITWSAYPRGAQSGAEAVEATPAQMVQRQDALLNLIAARTGLTPRTFVTALEYKTPEARDSNGGVGCLWALCCFPLALAVAEYYFPATGQDWINWGSIGSLGVVTCILLVTALRVGARRRTPLPYPAPPSKSAPSLDAPGAAYKLVWRAPVLQRLILIGVGAVMTANFLPPITMLVEQFGGALAGITLGTSMNSGAAFFGSVIVAFLLAMFGLVGPFMMYVGVRLTAEQTRADAAGITENMLRLTRFTPWAHMRDISWGRNPNGELKYVIQTDTSGRLISWPAEPQTNAAMMPSDGAIPIGPDELAALVAAQIGKPIRVREQA